VYFMLQAFDPSVPGKELDASGDLLTGSLPGTWGNASSLGAKLLAGTIPNSYGALLSGGARPLRLEANNLEGLLPAGWLNMVSAPAVLEAVFAASNPCLYGSALSWSNASTSQDTGSGHGARHSARRPHLGMACVTGATGTARQPAAFMAPDAKGGPHALAWPCSAAPSCLWYAKAHTSAQPSPLPRQALSHPSRTRLQACWLSRPLPSATPVQAPRQQPCPRPG
jgi:hypothetical protein